MYSGSNLETGTKSTSPKQKKVDTLKKRQLSNLEIATFCEQLAMIVNAGLPTYEGIAILMDDAPDEDTRAILAAIYEPLELGGSFHSALKDSGVFPKYVVDMVEIGEMSGKLDHVLSALHTYYEREESIRAGIRHAVTYPLIMMIIMVAIILVLITKVLPIFNQIYSELGAGLTGFALAMMNFSNFLNKYLFVVILLLALAILCATLLYHSDVGKILFQERNLGQSIAASRFANCMSLALHSGLDTTQGLELALKLVDNPHMEERIRRCKDFCETGKSFSESMMAAGIFDKLYASMLSIGIKTGCMDSIMERIATEYEERTNDKIAHFIATLEPTLIIILSVIIGLVLIAFLLPLIGIMSSIGFI